MKVLLIQPPHYYSGGSRPAGYFPLGLGYIAKVLMNADHKVSILDIWAHQYTNAEVQKKINEFDFDIIGISSLSTQYAYTKWLIFEIKKHRDCPVVVGNALATLTPEIVLNHTEADVCVIGEGEVIFKNVVENINRLEKVKGIHYKQEKRIFKTKPQEYIKNCYVYGTNIRSMNIVAGRGCPYNCKFCSKTFRNVRLRSVDNIIKEVEVLIEKYEIGGIVFSDELVIISKNRALELCEKLEPLKIKWNCQGRANVVDFETLKKMKKAGCVAVGYGVESGSQTILNNMKKMVTVEQNRQAIVDTNKLGMQPIVQLMYGYLGENEKTLKETEQFLATLPYTRRATLSITTPLPGSELWDYAIDKKLIKNEEEYLRGLAAGYTHDGRSPLINFTNFTEEEFYRRLKTVESNVFRNKIRKYPHLLAKDYVYRALVQYRRGGFKQFAKRAVRFIKWLS